VNVCIFLYNKGAVRKLQHKQVHDVMQNKNHFKEDFFMEFENKYASKGVAGTALGLGAGALGLELLKGGLGGLFGTDKCKDMGSDAMNLGLILNMMTSGVGTKAYGCSEDHHINRYEAAQSARIAELETEVKLRDANIYTDSKIADVYERLSGRINCVEGQIAQQAVYNATNTATLGCISGQIAQLMGLTKTIIPADNICPAPMPQYNSWTAPTAGA
jgi:hypothetical protein